MNDYIVRILDDYSYSLISNLQFKTSDTKLCGVLLAFSALPYPALLEHKAQYGPKNGKEKRETHCVCYF